MEELFCLIQNIKCVNNMEIQIRFIITCPQCGYQKEEIMPVDACQYFYECEQCKAKLKPKAGDCCVFCSYGNFSCPSVQEDENCCKN
jgi:hypothetical protein